MVKMKLQDLKDLFMPCPSHDTPHRDGLTVRKRATKKRHRHTHGFVWLPAKPRISPAEYRRRHLGSTTPAPPPQRYPNRDSLRQ